MVSIIAKCPFKLNYKCKIKKELEQKLKLFWPLRYNVNYKGLSYLFCLISMKYNNDHISHYINRLS